MDSASDPATSEDRVKVKLSLPVILRAVSPAILPAIIDGDLSDYLQSGSILTQRRRNRGCAGGARSPLQSAGAKVSFHPRNNMPSLSAGCQSHFNDSVHLEFLCVVVQLSLIHI